MQLENVTSSSQFVLEGLTDAEELRPLLFIIFLLIYLVAMVGNLGIVGLIFIDSRLHTPMYFFLANLSLLDSAYISNTVPQVLAHLLVSVRTIPYRSCLTQIFFHHFLAPWECFLLTAMAYDRYAAICQPLHYLVLMGRQTRLGRRKAFSTCGSHLTMVCIFYITSVLCYILPSSAYSRVRDRVLSVLFVILTPMLNPIVYSMRNKEVKRALLKALGKESTS
ncbi:olfactory receptor 5B12 [Sorex araneus]|uniref:olfactory receptor 5B12 n=1 Tax=Sorex araneus TaxID=42254 RepID=UPI002433FFF2|nr:olfactory receptor 5B12 [Sorex araneus]